MPTVCNRMALCVCLGSLMFVINQPYTVLAQAPQTITFEQLMSYVELEVNEEKLLKMLAASPTKFTLGEEQIAKLKSAGASDSLLVAIGRPATGRLEQSSDIRDFVIVLDASASMKDQAEGGQSKWDSAKQAAIDLINSIPNQRRLAFIVYGHDITKRCESIEALHPLSAIDDSSKLNLIRKIHSLTPSADTPIGASLALTRSMVAGSNELTKVILITDGMESCHGNPVAEATQLAAMPHLQGGVDVIGFGLKPQEVAEVEKIARSGRGKFYNAQNVDGLRQSVAKMERTMTTLVAIEQPRTAPPVVTKSSVKPGKEPSAPATIELQKYVSGRLATGKANYMTIDLPAGDYLVVCEASPSEGQSTNIQFRVSIDGEQLFNVNMIDRIERGAARFQSSGGLHNFTVENTSSKMAEYDFVVCPAAVDLPPSSFKKPGKEFRPLNPGDSVAIQLDPKSIETYESYFRMTLPEGDFELALTFSSPKATGNYGMYMDRVNTLGVVETQIGRSYDSAKSQSIRTKLLVADEDTWYLRLRTNEGQAPIEGTLSLKSLNNDPN